MYKLASNLRELNERLTQPLSLSGVMKTPEFSHYLPYLLNPMSTLLNSGEHCLFKLLSDELLERGILVPQELKQDEELHYLKNLFPLQFEPESFFRCEKIPLNRLNSDVSKLCFIAIPYDDGSTKPGTRYGPELLREVSLTYGWRGGLLDLTIRKSVDFNHIKDIGSLKMDGLNQENRFQVLETIIQSLSNRNIPICVGGDHSYTYPLVKALYRKDPELIFMYLDSHLDLQVWNQDPLHGESQICHSNFVSHLIRDLPFLKVGQLGAKRFLPIEKNQEINFLNQINKFEVLLDSESCENRPLAEIQKELPRGRRMYLSIDLDVLGSPYLQQTGHPNPSGISPMRLLSLLETLVKENHIVGLDFMEFGKSGARDVHRNEAVLVTELMLKIMQLLIGKFNE